MDLQAQLQENYKGAPSGSILSALEILRQMKDPPEKSGHEQVKKIEGERQDPAKASLCSQLLQQLVEDFFILGGDAAPPSLMTGDNHATCLPHRPTSSGGQEGVLQRRAREAGYTNTWDYYRDQVESTFFDFLPSELLPLEVTLGHAALSVNSARIEHPGAIGTRSEEGTLLKKLERYAAQKPKGEEAADPEKVETVVGDLRAFFLGQKHREGFSYDEVSRQGQYLLLASRLESAWDQFDAEGRLSDFFLGDPSPLEEVTQVCYTGAHERIDQFFPSVRGQKAIKLGQQLMIEYRRELASLLRIELWSRLQGDSQERDNVHLYSAVKQLYNAQFGLAYSRKELGAREKLADLVGARTQIDPAALGRELLRQEYTHEKMLSQLEDGFRSLSSEQKSAIVDELAAAYKAAIEGDKTLRLDEMRALEEVLSSARNSNAIENPQERLKALAEDKRQFEALMDAAAPFRLIEKETQRKLHQLQTLLARTRWKKSLPAVAAILDPWKKIAYLEKNHASEIQSSISSPPPPSISLPPSILNVHVGASSHLDAHVDSREEAKDLSPPPAQEGELLRSEEAFAQLFEELKKLRDSQKLHQRHQMQVEEDLRLYDRGGEGYERLVNDANEKIFARLLRKSNAQGKIELTPYGRALWAHCSHLGRFRATGEMPIKVRKMHRAIKDELERDFFAKEERKKSAPGIASIAWSNPLVYASLIEDLKADPTFKKELLDQDPLLNYSFLDFNAPQTESILLKQLVTEEGDQLLAVLPLDLPCLPRLLEESIERNTVTSYFPPISRSADHDRVIARILLQKPQWLVSFLARGKKISLPLLLELLKHKPDLYVDLPSTSPYKNVAQELSQNLEKKPLDSSDVMHPDFLQRCFELLEDYPSLVSLLPQEVLNEEEDASIEHLILSRPLTFLYLDLKANEKKFEIVFKSALKGGFWEEEELLSLFSKKMCELPNYPTLAKWTLEFYPGALALISSEIDARDYLKLAQLAVAKQPDVLRHVDGDFMLYEELVIPLLKKDHELFSYIDSLLHSDPKFMGKACGANVECFQYIVGDDMLRLPLFWSSFASQLGGDFFSLARFMMGSFT